MERSLIFVSLILGLFAVLHTEARVVVLSDDDLEEIQHVLRYGDPPHRMMDVERTGCSCVGKDCGCCLDLSIPQIKFKDLTCVNFTYLSEEYGLRVTFTINSYTVLNVTVSAKNPPPICFGIPKLEKFGSFCIDFYNLDVTDKKFSGCVKLQIRLIDVIDITENFGCFHIPLLDKYEAARANFMVQSIERSRQLAILGEH
jgi:hypothetical protein